MHAIQTCKLPHGHLCCPSHCRHPLPLFPPIFFFICQSLHPGFIKTDLAREVDAKWWGKLAMGLTGVVAMEPWQGAQTTIWAATSPEAAALNGDYLEHCAPAPVSHPQLADTTMAEALWARSLVVTGLAPWETIDDL